MKPILSAGAAASLLALTACVPQPRPAPPVQSRPAPAPIATPAPTPAPSNWLDAPQTPGDWRYQGGAGGGLAWFGDPGKEARFALRCDSAARTIALVRTASGVGPTTMTIRSETATRTLPAAAAMGELPAVQALLPSGDRLLDAIAFSKGRFAVEVPGAPALYLPSWAEVTRVIEDCR